jgi:hypothetical protein
MYVCICQCIYACVCAYIHIYTHAYAYIYTHAYAYTYIHTCLGIHIYTHMPRHTHIYTHAYAYTHTHMPRHTGNIPGMLGTRLSQPASNCLSHIFGTKTTWKAQMYQQSTAQVPMHLARILNRQGTVYMMCCCSRRACQDRIARTVQPFLWRKTLVSRGWAAMLLGGILTLWDRGHIVLR